MNYLPLLFLPILTSCGSVTPWGSMLVGTNASEIEISGNSQTGEYKLKAKDLNQSDSVGKVVDTVRVIKQTEAAAEVATATVSEAGSVTEFLAE